MDLVEPQGKRLGGMVERREKSVRTGCIGHDASVLGTTSLGDCMRVRAMEPMCPVHLPESNVLD